MKIKNMLLGSVLLATTSMLATDFTVDQAHSNLGFTVKHLAISNVKGVFKGFESSIDFDTTKKVFNKVSAQIDITSIFTDNKKRDDHLLSQDFFNAKKFPKAVFVMTKYNKETDESGKMAGNLTIMDVTLPVILNAQIHGIIKDNKGLEKVGLTLDGKINRKDFKIGADTANAMVSDEVKLNIDLELNEKK